MSPPLYFFCVSVKRKGGGGSLDLILYAAHFGNESSQSMRKTKSSTDLASLNDKFTLQMLQLHKFSLTVLMCW